MNPTQKQFSLTGVSLKKGISYQLVFKTKQIVASTKNNMKTRILRAASAVALLATLATFSAQAGVVLTVENPGVQQTEVPLALTETFDALSSGPLGTYLSPTIAGTYTSGQINPADEFGGAGGFGKYDTLTGLATQTLAFPEKKTYFGMWWSAGNDGNNVSFYDGATMVGSFDVGDIIPLLTPAYYGNPTPPFLGQNSDQPYAYVNFTATDGTLFDQVVFDNSLGGFESDNHSIYDQPITPPGHIPGVPDSGSTLAMMSGALGLLLAFRRKVK